MVFQKTQFIIYIRDIVSNISICPELLKNELNELINAGLNLPSASKYLAKKNGMPKNIIYNLY